MKKVFRFALVAAASLAIAGGAYATPTASSFQTLAGEHFTHDFLVTPAANDALVLLVSGSGAQYSDLSFDFIGGPHATGRLIGGSWVVSFNDVRSPLTLLGGTTYTLRIEGDTKAAIPGGFGVVSISSRGGDILPVPEPESYAMLLAGLGLIGTIVRRRSKSPTA